MNKKPSKGKEKKEREKKEGEIVRRNGGIDYTFMRVVFPLPAMPITIAVHGLDAKEVRSSSIEGGGIVAIDQLRPKTRETTGNELSRDREREREGGGVGLHTHLSN